MFKCKDCLKNKVCSGSRKGSHLFCFVSKDTSPRSILQGTSVVDLAKFLIFVQNFQHSNEGKEIWNNEQECVDWLLRPVDGFFTPDVFDFLTLKSSLHTIEMERHKFSFSNLTKPVFRKEGINENPETRT